MIEAKEILLENNDWIAAVFLAILLLLTLIKILFKRRLSHTNVLFLQQKYLLIYFDKDKSTTPNVFQSLFFIVQILVLSLLFYFVNYHFYFKTTFLSFKGFFVIAGIVGLYFSCKFCVDLFLAKIFNLEQVFSKFMYERQSYYNNLVLWILPVLIVSVYASKFNKNLFVVVFTIFMLLSFVRYMLLLLNNKKLAISNLFYFILYLCALEIAPLIIVLKSIV